MEGTGERSKSEGMYIYIKLIHFAVHQNQHNQCKIKPICGEKSQMDEIEESRGLLRGIRN